MANYRKAVDRLDQAILLAQARPLSQLEQQGLIQAFQFTHELAWNLMKDWFDFQGKNDITGSRDATREAFRMGLIRDGDVWMQMIRSRNQSSHTYDEKIALQVSTAILEHYGSAFRQFRDAMAKRAARQP